MNWTLYTIFLPLIFFISCNYNSEKKANKTDPGISPGGSGSVSDKMRRSTNSLGMGYDIIGNQCVSCHNVSRAEGNAQLDSIEAVRSLLERIRSRALVKQDMPPKNPLSKVEIAILNNWLDKGAPIEAGGEEWSVSEAPTYDEVKLRVFEKKCFQCHSGANPEANLDLENYEMVKAAKDQIAISTLIKGTMPISPFEELTKKEKKLLSYWLIEGVPL